MICKIQLPSDMGSIQVCGSDDDRSVMPLMQQGNYEPHVQELMAKIVSSDMIVADIGANYGQHTGLLSKLVGHDGKVIAVEASENNMQYLIQTLQMNNCEHNVELINKGVWEKSGTMQLHHSDSGAGWSFFATNDTKDKHDSSRVAVDVEMVTLDSILPEKIDFIKIDIEGSELHALRGATRILSTLPPLMIELNTITAARFMNLHINELVDYIYNCGYKYAYIPTHRYKWRLINPLDLKRWKFEVVDTLFVADPLLRKIL